MLLTTFLLTELGEFIYHKVKETAKEAVPVALAEMGTKTIFKTAGEQIKKFYGGKKFQENGDLLKAIRIAMLDATLLVVDEAFTEMKKDAVESPFIIGNKIAILQKQFNKWIAEEKKLAGKKATEEIINTVAYEQIERLISNSQNDDAIKLRADLAQSCKNEFLTELKVAFKKDFPPLIEEYLLNGWGDDKDWFDCTCFQFGQLLKQDEFKKSRIAFENDLLSKIAVDGGVLNIKIDAAIKLLEQSVSYGTYILEKLKQLDRIEKNTEIIINHTSAIKDDTTEIKADIKKILLHAASSNISNVLDENLGLKKHSTFNYNTKIDTIVKKIIEGERLRIGYKSKINTITGHNLINDFIDTIEEKCRENNITVISWDASEEKPGYIYLPSYNLIKVAAHMKEFRRHSTTLLKIIDSYPSSKIWNDHCGAAKFLIEILKNHKKPIIGILKNTHWTLENDQEDTYVYGEEIPVLNKKMSIIIDIYPETVVDKEYSKFFDYFIEECFNETQDPAG